MPKRFQIGIDEAGRGALIGPLVVAGIRVDESSLRLLSEMGVRDSKRLSPAARERLYSEIVAVVEEHEERIYPAWQVDTNSLTTLELNGIVSILNTLGPVEEGKIVIDCIGKLARGKVERLLDTPNGVELVYEPKADERYTACQAASIIAKVTRDREIVKLHQQIGIDFGKGYPNQGTVEFIREYMKARGELPPHTRTRWRSIEKML